ncbi:uncharacterized protein Dyak_GE29062, isoform A [Drosophila yakuba]|uniref:Uncharacterized protein, isoform A n=1 Tax=Drosophila yakuba TaxID=7245 RepID=A0A0R1DMT5_DROYA|nr:uncharacterized protein Dyak_GE29062, isoform A [Drosophila yakuba]
MFCYRLAIANSSPPILRHGNDCSVRQWFCRSEKLMALSPNRTRQLRQRARQKETKNKEPMKSGGFYLDFDCNLGKPDRRPISASNRFPATAAVNGCKQIEND